MLYETPKMKSDNILTTANVPAKLIEGNLIIIAFSNTDIFGNFAVNDLWPKSEHSMEKRRFVFAVHLLLFFVNTNSIC